MTVSRSPLLKAAATASSAARISFSPPPWFCGDCAMAKYEASPHNASATRIGSLSFMTSSPGGFRSEEITERTVGPKKSELGRFKFEANVAWQIEPVYIVEFLDRCGLRRT